MKEDHRPKYIQALKEELSELRQEFENLPATEDNSSKRWRLNADVLQTEWRLHYCAGLANMGPQDTQSV
jgi:hypothetical protein